MMKLRDVLTDEELKEIEVLESKMLHATTSKDINYYQNKIEEIMESGRQRYYASKELNTNNEQAAAKETSFSSEMYRESHVHG
jgi:hypothetical protein